MIHRHAIERMSISKIYQHEFLVSTEIKLSIESNVADFMRECE